MNAALPVPAGRTAAAEWISCGNGGDTFLSLPVQAGGVEARAILDSGATCTVIDSAFAARRELRLAQQQRVTGLTGAIAGSAAGPLDISAGAEFLFTAPALVMDLAPIARAAATQIDLVLGHDLFLQRAIDIDPHRAALRFLDYGSENITHWLPVEQMSDGHFCTTIELMHGLRARAIIDLGCLAPLYVSPGFAARHDLFRGLRRGSSASVGVEGVAISELGRLPRLQLGDSVLHDIPFSVPPAWAFAAPIVMGLPLLMRFHGIFDFGRSRMHMTPADGLDRPFLRDRSGLSVVHAGGRLDVLHVAADSPAAKAGLCPGDSIVAINNEAVATPGARNHRNLGKRPAGTRYVLSLLAKGTREMVLEEYY